MTKNKPIIPQFLLDEFKKNPRAIKMLHYPEEILEFISDFSKFYEWEETDVKRIFKIMKQGIREMPICEVDGCNKKVYVDYYAVVQKGCCKKHNTIITSLKKYGVEHVSKTKQFQEDKISTIKSKYKTDHVFQSNYFKDKRKETMISKYGTDISMHIPEAIERMKITRKNTINLKYGVDYSTQTKIFKKKSKITMLKKYGVEYAMQSNEIKEKSKHSTLKKYGVENPSQNKKIRNKIRTTMESKGVWTPLDMIDDFELYRRQVWIETRKQDISSLKHSEKRGVKDYHLDHKFSIMEGFKNNILPAIIGNIKNLEFIPAKENISKNSKCSIELEELV